MMPTNVAARMTLAADPGSLQGAVAAGILGCGPVILGTAEECARLLEARAGAVDAGDEPAAVAEELARAVRGRASRLPGFGHPVHQPLDPRAERILELADERGVSGPHVALARGFREAAAATWGKPLTMNVSMPIAAVMLDLGFPPAAVKAVPILARTAGLLAHLAEEQRAADRLPDGGGGRGGGRVRRRRPRSDARARGRDPAVGRAARARRRRATASSSPTCSSARPSTARSSRGRVDSAAEAGGLADIAQLPLTEKQELRATCTAENPIGAHLCVGARRRSSGSTRRAARPARRATSR